MAVGTGTGANLPQLGDVRTQPMQVQDADKLFDAQSWQNIARSGEKLAESAGAVVKQAAYQQQVGAYAEMDVADSRQATKLRDQFAGNPDGFDAAWKAYGDGVIEQTPEQYVSHRSRVLGTHGNSAFASILSEKRAKDNALASESLNTSITNSDNELIAAAAAGNMSAPSGVAAFTKYKAQVDAAVNSGMMSPEKRDFMLDDVQSRALGEVAGLDGVRIFSETGGNERAAVDHLQKNILENEDLKLSPAARRRAFNAGRQQINIEKVGAQADRAQVVQTGRELVKAIESGQPYDQGELQDAKDSALRVGAAALHRQLSVVSGVKEQTDHLSISEKANLVSSRNSLVGTPDQANAVATAANNLGVAPRDLAAAISYETGGKFDPNLVGGKGNNYLGLIQFGPEERAKYGVKPGMSFEQQMGAVENFLRDRGVTPGMGISEIYRTINGGNPNASLNASDGNGTIAQHIERIKAGHYANADRFLGGTGTASAAPDYTREITKGIQDNLIKDARRAWPAMQQQISAGTLPDREDVDAVRTAAALSGDEGWYKKVEEVALAGRIYDATKNKPQLDRQALMDQAGAELSAATNKALQVSFDHDNKMLRDDQFGYALEKGAAKPDQLNLGDSAQFRQTLANRSTVVQGVARDQGVSPGSVLRQPEIGAVKAALEGASPDGKLRIFSDMASSLSEPIYRATMEKLGNDTLTMFVGNVALDRPDLAREILRGADLMSTEKTGDKQSLVRPAFQEKIGRDLYPSAADQNNVTQAAMALYTARRGTAGALYDPTDSAGIEKAIEDVAGKITKRNGMKVAIPPGMTEGTFNRVMTTLTTDKLADFGGAFDRTGKPFDPRFLGDRAALKQLGPGESHYVVGLPDATARDGFAPVVTSKGTPLVIDIKQLAAASPSAALTPFQAGVTQFRTGQAERIQDARRQSLEAPVRANPPEFKTLDEASAALKDGRIANDSVAIVGGKRTKVYFNPAHESP